MYNDGSFSYSKTVAVRLDGDANVELANAYPNPFTNASGLVVAVNMPSTDLVNIRVIDIQGKTLMTKSQTVDAGKTNISLDAANELKAGIYFLSIDAAGKQQVIKVVKQQ